MNLGKSIKGSLIKSEYANKIEIEVPMSRFTKSLLMPIMCILLSSSAICAEQSELTITELAQDHFNFSCVQLEIVGVCFWLKCSLLTCSVEYSVLNSHFSPDLFVESRRSDSHSAGILSSIQHQPAKQIGKTLLGVEQGQGSKTASLQKKAKSSLQFTDVSITGSADIIMTDMIFNQMFNATGTFEWCDSKVTPFYPYFNSLLDLEWRLGLYEMLASVGNTDRKIEDNTNPAPITWGKIYPRTGHIIGDDPYRTSAVNVHKGADFITSDDHQWPHLYSAPPSDPNEIVGRGYGHVKESSDKAGKWQLNHPRERGNSCYIFPDPEAKLNSISSSNGNYIWTLWRKYNCCRREGQTFLYKIEFEDD